VTNLRLQQQPLAQLLAVKVLLPSRQALVEGMQGQQPLQLQSVVDQEEPPLYLLWQQVVALEQPQQQPHRLVVEQQPLRQLQLLQRIHHHDIYPTSKPLTMRHLL